MRKYITNNLDEAVFLILKGQPWKMEKLGIVLAEFTFEDNKELQKYRKKFWSGSFLYINLHHWLNVRRQIKAELRASQTTEEKIQTESVVGHSSRSQTWTPGEKYWYLSNGSVCTAIYGNSAMHWQRNKFKSLEEAQASI